MSTEEPTYFGDSETPATVPANKLEPGVWIDSTMFNPSGSNLLVQEVRDEGKVIGLTAVNTFTGYPHQVSLWADRPVTTWGKL